MTDDTGVTTLGGALKGQGPMTQTAIDAIKAIPPRKRFAKVWQTLAGLCVIGATVSLRVWLGPEVPWWVVVGGAAFGGVMISKELFVMTAKTVIGLFRDVMAVREGKDSE